MPIVGEDNNVYIEYTMPKYIRELITDDFLKEFRNQLFRILKYCSLDSFADEGIPLDTPTSGWGAAFGKACLITNSEQLLDYWRTLPWYDIDIFAGELADMLVERRFILGDSGKVIGNLLNINPDEIVRCCDCGRYYTKDMTTVFMEDDLTQYRCLFCQDVKNTIDGNKDATDYYRSVLKELDEYKKKHPANKKGEE